MLIEIKPVTRIEGHLYVYIEVKDSIEVQLRATGFRGFERILIGRAAEEAPFIASRICGICSVAHHLASVKAIENAFGVEVPEYVKITREIMGLSGVVQSHLLHIAFLLYPDIELNRNTKDILTSELRKTLISIYRYATHITEIIGGRHIHPINIIPGGLARHISMDDINIIEDRIRIAITLFEKICDQLLDRMSEFVDILVHETSHKATAFATLTDNDNEATFYDGDISVVYGNELKLRINPNEYTKYIVEDVASYSYSKRPYVILNGSKNIFKVGPLPRSAMITNIPFEISKKLYLKLKSLIEKYGMHPALYNIARLIETIYCFEKILSLISILRRLPVKPRTRIDVRDGEGIGVIEAPRGLLIHHYKIDKNGLITYANIITPTAINIPAIEVDIKETVRRLIDSSNEVGYVKKIILYLIRSYDPCISCSTHSINIIRHNIA